MGHFDLGPHRAEVLHMVVHLGTKELQPQHFLSVVQFAQVAWNLLLSTKFQILAIADDVYNRVEACAYLQDAVVLQ